MGASCCGKPAGSNPPANHVHHESHEHDGCEPCDDREKGSSHEDCRSDSLSTTSGWSTCCGAEEHCDEKCIYSVAALECQQACKEDMDHENSLSHPHEHFQSYHEAGSSCNTHLQAAFAKYGSYLEQLRCICRSVIDHGTATHGTCCFGKRAGSINTTGVKHSGHSHKEKKARTDGIMPARVGPPIPNVSTDAEKTGHVETVSFLVSGMDCTSCADKLMRAFNVMPGVSQPQVNFVMGKGEFTVNTAIANADHVIYQASTATGFSLSKIIGGDYFLDVLASPGEAKRLASDPPRGVTDVQFLDKKTVRLSYEPTAIGARDLFDLVKDRCHGLAQPRGDPQLENSRRRLWDQLTKTTLAAALTIPVAVLAWSDNIVNKRTEGIVSMVLATLVQSVAIPEFYRPALSSLWYSHVIEMDMLVVMSITAAYLYSVIAFGFAMAGRPLDEGEFFETSTMLITLILLGRLIAALARLQAVAAVSLRSKQNNMAVLVHRDGDKEIDARLLQYGDHFKVLPHSRIPTDGRVVSGISEVDESMLTGETLPIIKQRGDALIAGTVNGDGTVTAQLTRLPGKNTVTDIAQLVEEAANSKPELQDLANQIAGWFVPVMAGVAVLVFVIWIACGIKILGYSTGRSIGNAVTYAVATLAVACPCALGLAVPMVLVVSGGIAARGGVIIKSADVTEGARKTTDVVFDKTGTLTESELRVAEQVNFTGDLAENIALSKALVAGGKHPVSAAVEKHLQKHDARPTPGVTNVRVIPGAGIEADYQESTVRAGNARWTQVDSRLEVSQLQRSGLSTLIVTKDSVPLIGFGLEVQIRPEACRVISELKARDIAVHLVSGDQTVAVNTVAAVVGIPLENVTGERTPAEKRDYVSSLMEDKSKHVLFCGDGTNDAAAVAQAHVGAQMGGGLTSSDVTQGAADVILLNGLECVLFLLNVSRASFHRMTFNFVWSGIYNVLAVSMASGAWVKFRIPPAYAGLGEMVSVVPVILAALSMFFLNFRV